MKLRTDFVTNSSSSSFVLARKREFSDEEKEFIIKFIENNFLGRVVLNSDSSEEEVADFIDGYWYYDNDELKKEVRKLLADGYSIYSDNVDFEFDATFKYAELLTSLWEGLKELDGESFKIIDGDLSYWVYIRAEC